MAFYTLVNQPWAILDSNHQLTISFDVSKLGADSKGGIVFLEPGTVYTSDGAETVQLNINDITIPKFKCDSYDEEKQIITIICGQIDSVLKFSYENIKMGAICCDYINIVLKVRLPNVSSDLSTYETMSYVTLSDWGQELRYELRPIFLSDKRPYTLLTLTGLKDMILDSTAVELGGVFVRDIYNPPKEENEVVEESLTVYYKSSGENVSQTFEGDSLYNQEIFSLQTLQENSFQNWEYLKKVVRNDRDISIVMTHKTYFFVNPNNNNNSIGLTSEILPESRYLYYLDTITFKEDPKLLDLIKNLLSEKQIEWESDYLMESIQLKSGNKIPSDIKVVEFFDGYSSGGYADLDVVFKVPSAIGINGISRPSTRPVFNTAFYLNGFKFRLYSSAFINVNDAGYKFTHNLYISPEAENKVITVDKTTLCKMSTEINQGNIVGLTYFYNLENGDFWNLEFDENGKISLTPQDDDSRQDIMYFYLTLNSPLTEDGQSPALKRTDQNSLKLTWVFDLTSPRVLLVGSKWQKPIKFTFSDNSSWEYGNSGSAALVSIDGEETLDILSKDQLPTPNKFGLFKLAYTQYPQYQFDCFCLQRPVLNILSPIHKTFSLLEQDLSSGKYYYSLSAQIYFHLTEQDLCCGDEENFTKIQQQLLENIISQWNLIVQKTSGGSYDAIDWDLSINEKNSSAFLLTAKVPITRWDDKLYQRVTLRWVDTYSGLYDEAQLSISFTDKESLYMPTVVPISPAVFISTDQQENTISIPFTTENNANVCTPIVKIFNLNNELVFPLTDSSYTTKIIPQENNVNSYIAQITTTSSFNIGQYYKASIALSSNSSGIVSPWSDFTIFKVTSMPAIIRASWLREDIPDIKFLNDIIYYSYVQDKTEPLEKIKYFYELGIKNKDNIYHTEVEEIYFSKDDSQNFEYAIILKSLLDFDSFRNWCQETAEAESSKGSTPIYVTLKVEFFTKNGSFTWSEPGSKDGIFKTPTLPSEVFYLYRLNNSQASYYFIPDEQYGLVSIEPNYDTQDVAESRLNPKWRLYNGNVLLSQQNGQRESLIDKIATYNNNYRTFSLSQNIYNHFILCVFQDDVCCDFDGVFLIDETTGQQLNITLNNNINSLKSNILEQKNDVIGSRYPVFFRNPYTKYREFTLSGTISTQSLILFGQKYGINTIIEDNGGLREATSSLSLNIGPNSSDIIWSERQFREKVLEFLQQNKAFLYKSPTEGVIVVKIMNVQLTPNKTLSRMIYDFSCTCYEVQDVQSYLNEIKGG